MDKSLQVVWFKRDLRVRDHAPLARAARRGPVLPLYVAEPSVAGAPDYSPRHWTLVREGLYALRRRLATLGQPLVVRVGEMPAVLDALHNAHGPFHLWAHQETGNGRTFARDRRVRRWAQERGVPFTEVPGRGVVRRLPSRDEWADRWEAAMRQPLVLAPAALRPLGIAPGRLPAHAALGLGPCTAALQEVSPRAAHRLLRSFLDRRGLGYRSALSSPLAAETAGSRLSVHLAYGTISLRTVVHAVRERKGELLGVDHKDARTWRRALAAFESRLHWHSHFMQKLEDAPRIEHESYIPAFDALRADAFDEHLYVAWRTGCTGFPMVDAAMRCLRATGWLNFRMRAMLCSFAAYDCWLDWRRFAPFYAGLMADYEAGIHYPQVQMQSGTTGINTVRIYNPVKQGKEHDPDGTFIRRWLPELRGVQAAASVHEPWTMPPIEQHASGCVVGRDYPAPVVEGEAARRRAREAVHALRETPAVQAAAEAILRKHGSRR